MLKIYEHKFSAMGSPCALHLYCTTLQQFNHISCLCENEVRRLESKYSRYQANSFLSQLNSNAGASKIFALDYETLSLIQYANTAFEISDGLFDITSGVLRKVWDFKSGVIPDTTQITEILEFVGWDKLKIDPAAFSLPQKGIELDLGGIVKEYAADKVVALARLNNIQHGLVDLGGDITIIGPHPDNTPWQIAISHPQSPAQTIASIPLMSGGLASSGDYQRYITLNNERYSHILNPKTGWPVKGLAAVSVWAQQCVMAGTIATTAMLKGETEGLQWLDEIGCQYVAVDQKMKVKMYRE
jgi:thiamine biosynthesis lipoprotein